MTKVPATFVLISPYLFQNSKKVEFVAKHGALFFAVIFFLYMNLCINAQSYSWVLFLPQVVFYSLTYIIGCISDNKTFQQIQILINSILIPYSFGLICFVKITSLVLLLVFAYFLMVIYPSVLYVVHRKHYVKDLSTPESVSRLNFVDFCNVLLVTTCIGFAVVFAIGHNPTLSIQNIYVAICLMAGNFIGILIRFFYLYIDITHRNRSKSMLILGCVEFDCNGRAWCAFSTQISNYLRRLPNVAAFNCLFVTDVIRLAARLNGIDEVVKQRMLKNFL